MKTHELKFGLLLFTILVLSGCQTTGAHNKAASEGNITAISEYLAKGNDVDTLDSQKNSALFSAAQNGQLEAVKFLVTSGANVNLWNGDAQVTALMVAAFNGSDQIVELLIEAGADINAQSGVNGFSAVERAVFGLQPSTVNVLIAAGANLNLTRINGENMIHSLVSGGYREWIEEVKSYSKSNDLEQKEWLENIMSNSRPKTKAEQIAITLLSAGVDPNLPDNKDYSKATPLFKATQLNNLRLVKILLAWGADPNIPVVGKATPLYIAAHSGNVAVVKLLVAFGAELNAQATSGSTALVNAVVGNPFSSDSKREEITRVLLAAGADPNIYNNNGYTPLHFAVKNKKLELVKLLLAAGANPNLKSRQGTFKTFSASDYATEFGDESMIAVFRQYGGEVQSKSNDSQLFTKLFVTAAIGGVASMSDIPIENQIEVMGAATKDIWLEDGKGNNLSNLNKSLSDGTYQIQDPNLKKLAETRLEMEQQNQVLQKQLADYQKQMLQQQSIQRQALQKKTNALVDSSASADGMNTVQSKIPRTNMVSNSTAPTKKVRTRTVVDKIHVESMAYCIQSNKNSKWWCAGPLQTDLLVDNESLNEASRYAGCANYNSSRNRSFRAAKHSTRDDIAQSLLLFCEVGIEPNDHDIADRYLISEADKRARNTYKCPENQVRECTVLHQRNQGNVANFQTVERVEEY